LEGEGESVRLIKQGAEAKIYRGSFKEVFGVELLDEDVVVKHRIPKRYRIREIDERLRKERTVREARILHRAKEAGVFCPHLYEVDLRDMKIVMEFVEGERLKEYLEQVPMEERLKLCREVGRQIGLLHEAGIVHGDLTTSNMILRDGKVYLIDFGLADFDGTLEAQGVDLHLLRRAMESTHYTWFDRGFAAVIEGYREVRKEEKAAQIMDKIREIEERGRYRERGWVS
jgi:TP53 regulating kinase-like protein